MEVERFPNGRLLGQPDPKALETAPELPVRRYRLDDTVTAQVDDFRRRRGNPPPGAAFDPSPTERTVAHAEGLPPDALVTVAVQGPELEFDFSRFRRADADQRRALVAERRAQLEPLQDALAERLENAGAAAIAPRWIANQLAARLPAGAVATVAGWPEVEGLYLDDDRDGPGGYSGREARAAMLADRLVGAAVNGNAGSRGGGPIRIGVMEGEHWSGGGNRPDPVHVGWVDVPGWPSRYVARRSCGTLFRTCRGLPQGDANDRCTHATLVSWVALGSIEQGQDSAYPDTGIWEGAQAQRSGIAPEAELYFYGVDSDCGAKAVAIQQAVLDGVDIVNYSGWDSTTQCRAARNCGGVNQVLRHATDAGVLFVGCAGNSGRDDGCRLWYPSYRPEALAVNGLWTWSPQMHPDASRLLGSASAGGLPLRLWSGMATPEGASGVGLAAPGMYHLYFTAGESGYGGWGEDAAGCSFASPAVAGAAALLRHTGWDSFDARALHVNLLVLGDAWDDASGDDMRTGVSPHSGFGRLHLHRPSGEDLVAPWGWGWRGVTVHHREELRWTVWDEGPEDPRVTQWKWAAIWFEDDYRNVADIVVDVYDTCPPGGGEERVAGDWSWDYQKRAHLTRDEICPPGRATCRCLEMRVRGLDVPPEGRLLYSADYFHAGEPALH